MGVVRFERHRTELEDMPSLCLRCGAPATVAPSKTFSKSQGWTTVLIFFGGVPYLLATLVFRNRLRVRTPLCDAHRHHFNWQAGILWGGLAALALMLAGCFAMIPNGGAMTDKCFGAVGILAAVWVVVLLVNRLSGIQAAAVSDRDALVVGVSAKFARAYEAAGRADEPFEYRRSQSDMVYSLE
jgi:hypothetical protein